MPARRRLTTLAAVALAAAAATGCGSSNELPRDIPSASAPGLVTNLNAVLADCQQGDRASAERAAKAYGLALAALPDTVNPDVRNILTQTSENLTTLAQDPSQCVTGPSGPSGAQGVLPSTSTSTNTTPTTTTTTDTTSTDTTSTDTTTTDTTPPATQGNGNQGGGNGGGKPSGGGNGGGSGGSSGGVGAGKANKSKHSKGHR